MPHRSDNLYSADSEDEASGTESFSEELSPSDGYFNPATVPSDRMVQDPSLDTKEAEPKTLMPLNTHRRNGNGSQNSVHPLLPQPRAYALSNSGSTSTNAAASYTPLSTMANPREDYLPRRPLSINGPPPAYSPPQSLLPSPETSMLAVTAVPNYSTFLEQHLERGRLPEREPESMGQLDESTPLAGPTFARERPSPWKRFVSKAVPKSASRRFYHLLVAVMVFVVVMGLLGSMAGKESDDDADEGPITGAPPSKDSPLEDSGSYCSYAKHRLDPVSFDIPMGWDLTLIQSTASEDWTDGSVKVVTAGEIRLRKLPKGSKAGDQGLVSVDIYVSDPSLPILRTWDGSSRTLEIQTPRWTNIDRPSPQCVSVEITAWLPEDAEVTGLEFEAVTLDLRVFGNAKAKVTGHSKFYTVTGKVQFPIPTEDGGNDHGFSSRWVEVETVSGAIIGAYPLLDYLGLGSTSGHIDVAVDPHPVLPESPAPATLEARTASGNIKINLPIKDSSGGNFIPPPRNYITKVKSEAGSTYGSYYLGSSSTFHTTSGTITITALPVLDADAADRSNIFETATVSQNTDITVLSPIFLSLLASKPYIPIHNKDPYLLLPPTMSASFALSPINKDAEKTRKLRSLKSNHGSTSARIRAHYPSEWEGKVKASTLSGKISVTGDHLTIIKDTNNFGMKEVVALKDVDGEEEGGVVEMGTIAANLDFSVGE